MTNDIKKKKEASAYIFHTFFLIQSRKAFQVQHFVFQKLFTRTVKLQKIDICEKTQTKTKITTVFATN